VNTRILMIEDDLEMLDLGRIIVEKEGWEFLPAYGCEEGLRVLREKDVDLIILDIMMRGLNGWEFLDIISSDENLRSIPVIVLTARHYLEDEEETERYRDKFTHYIVKPFSVRDLVEKIREALEKEHHSGKGVRARQIS